MRLTTASTALAGLVLASGATARPFWSKAEREIPELTLQEWQATKSGDFNGIAGAEAHAQKDVEDSFHRIWDSVKHAAAAPIHQADAAIDGVESLIEDYVDEYLATLTDFDYEAYLGNVDHDDDSEKTIWQLLQQDEEKYSKIVKLLKLEETGKAIEVLDDRKTSITFFAPGEREKVVPMPFCSS